MSTGEVRRGELHEGFQEKSSRAPVHSTCEGPVSRYKSAQACDFFVVGLVSSQAPKAEVLCAAGPPLRGKKLSLHLRHYSLRTFVRASVIVQAVPHAVRGRLPASGTTRKRGESALVCDAVLALLGWEVKQVDGKVPAFEQSFVALGRSTTCIRQSATCL